MKNRTIGQLKNERKKRRLFILAVFAAVTIYLAIQFFLGDMGYMSYRKLAGFREGLHEEIAAIETRNDELRREVEGLRKDPEYIEKMARENLGMGRDGEMIFHFDE